LVKVFYDDDTWALGFQVFPYYFLTAAHNLRDIPQRNDETAIVTVAISALDKKTKYLNYIITVDPASDLAIFGKYAAPGDQLPRESIRKLRFLCRPDRCIPLLLTPQRHQRTISVHVLTHTKRWLTGSAALTPNSPRGEVRFKNPNERIIGGTSGAPVFNTRGAVIGLITNAPDTRPIANFTVLPYALPLWFYNDLKAKYSGEQISPLVAKM